ncbi:SpaH/EbpB family LPXTG-anchored major pilin [Corynebacterium hindlerae]|uniref:SpaH/EbpB family LPXTG-anchored major pilin n=1 Tax=Corynebacterium hindlerae TaxID=699041 RepID=A0A7G5FDE5_9CORY|nr:SpaH/EbpB family LPXTG-anchored major pilin [Corynebacterium hindlerae]QMV84636.1 SpaH/EbpB family LPXTG-anchored major pilin [Corynebacterium hindlerae]
MSTFSQRIAAVIAAGALAFGGTFAAMPSAGAQAGTETTPAPAPAAPTGEIDPKAQVTLTIKKYLGEIGDTSNGLDGAQFKIEKLNDVDLTTQAGWEKLAGLTAATANDVTEIKTVTTANGGTATVSTADTPNFTVGAYKITELNRAGYTTAAPFLITLPYNDAQSGNWNYTREVAPKNQNVQPNKQVDDSKGALGGTLTYTVNAPVPAGAMDRFIITDKLVDNLQLTSQSIVVGTTGKSTVALASPGDYTLSEDNNTVTVTFTREGMNKLQEARKDDPTLQVTVKFDAKVVSIPTDGKINNTATISLPNGAEVTTDVPADTDPNTPDGPTSTTFGDLTITKTGSDNKAELDGATFQIYQCQKQEDSTWQLLGQPLTVSRDQQASDLKDTIETTGGTAEAKAYGLPASSFSGGATGVVANQYCVLETKAPKGYVRNPDPQPVNYEPTSRAFTATVNNAKDSIIGQLPATGAWGIVLVFLVGIALLARGLYTSYKDNKQSA